MRGRGVIIARTLQALEVEKEEKRKISYCFKKERNDRESERRGPKVWIIEQLHSCFFPSPPLSCTDS